MVRVWIALWTVYIVWGSTYLASRYVVETIPALLSLWRREFELAVRAPSFRRAVGDEQKDRRRLQILAGAKRVFAAKGFQNATIGAVAKAGIGAEAPRSAWVKTATTPGSARAASASTDTILAWACGLRRIAAMRGSMCTSPAATENVSGAARRSHHSSTASSSTSHRPLLPGSLPAWSDMSLVGRVCDVFRAEGLKAA